MENSKNVKRKTFSKANVIVETSSKQTATQTQNIVAPIKPKEIKKK